MAYFRGSFDRNAERYGAEMFGGGGASLPANPTPAYQFAQPQTADAGALGGTQSLNTNPNASYNSGAATQAGSALTQGAPQLTGYAGQALTNAFDPQNALFAQQFAQQHQQGNVVNAENGVAGTPYGAGLMAQNDQNFDIAWQKQQLQNQNTGAQTAASLYGAGDNAAQTGTAVGQSVPGFQNQQLQQQIQDYLAYLSGGTGASNAATGQYTAEANATLQNQQLQNQSTAGLGSLAGTLGAAALFAL